MKRRKIWIWKKNKQAIAKTIVAILSFYLIPVFDYMK